MRLLVRGGLVLATDGWVEADVVVDGGVVALVGDAGTADADQIVEAGGCLVGPGLVDLHSHFRDPGQTWKEDLASGSRAAAAGGFTAVVAMPNTDPPIDRADLVVEVRERADRVGLVELSVAGALTRSRAGAEPSDVDALYQAGVRVFTDDGDSVEDDDLLLELMERVAALPSAVVAQHAEARALTRGAHIHDGPVARRLGLRGMPAEAEERIVSRDIDLARLTGARYHCQHVSSAGTVDLVRRAKEEGLEITAEVTPHHLSFDETDLAGLDANYKMYPPLRGPADRLALLSGLADGTIDAVATDHAPHAPEDKDGDFASAARGVTGLETAAAVVWGLTEDPDLLFDRLSTAPARIAGLARHGRRLAIGGVANIVVFDPDRQWLVDRFESKSANSPYKGRELKGKVIATIHSGETTHHMETERT